DRLGGLALNGLGQRVVCRQVDAAGVDQLEANTVPLALQHLAVPRDAGLAIDHDLTPPREPVDERRLAGVREADDGDLGRAVAHRPTRPRSSAMPTMRS